MLLRLAIPHTGAAWRNGRLTNEGRFSISDNPRNRGAFKTPTLRESARTALYMHDGSIATLEDVIDFYSEGGHPNPALDSEIRPRDFTPEEKHALIAFLQSLNGRVVEGYR
jgi:cytochrome c peroxidase